PSLSSYLSSHPPTPAIYTLSLHDALPICRGLNVLRMPSSRASGACMKTRLLALALALLPLVSRAADDLRADEIARRASENGAPADRKSTRLNSSHQIISYAVFCLKKKQPQ